ncbi:MAG TPA: hypothetical protein VLJ17_03330 [Xanthobacteraceae bacterium]|nr:hypothetical protein [Xanthobacteraceae bacterium]
MLSVRFSGGHACNPVALALDLSPTGEVKRQTLANKNNGRAAVNAGSIPLILSPAA